MHTIPYGRQYIDQSDIDAVVATLRSDYVTQGPKIDEFETAFAAYVDARYAVAVANGTAALHLAALALNVQAGDAVITPANTFVASANCVRYCGGDVLFADIDPRSYTIDLNYVGDLLKNSQARNIKGVIAVDFAGYPVDLQELRALADKYGLWILADACHAPGGEFRTSDGVWRRCGDGVYAECSIFSFHPVKHIAAGEGGMITTNNADLYRRLRSLRTHGITADPALLHERHGGWYYEMQELGFNYRLTDIQAALGLAQLTRAEQRLERRRAIADFYNDALRDTSLTLPAVAPNVRHAYHLYVVQSEGRKALYDFLHSKGIRVQVHYIPVHRQPYYRSVGASPLTLPNIEHYYQRCLSLPMYPELTQRELEYVVAAIQEFDQLEKAA